jgi:hypothetical protein
MTRTCTPHTSTITSLASLLTLRTDPLDKLISKTQVDTTHILAQFRLHTIQSMRHLPHQVSHGHTPHLPFPHLHTPMNDIHNQQARHTPPGGGGGSKEPQDPLERLDLGGSQYYPDL